MKTTLTSTGQNPRSLPLSRETDWPLYSLHQAVNHIFHDFFRHGDLSLPSVIFSEDMDKFTPRVNLSETEKEYLVSAELPGMNQNDIDVSISRDMLIVRGEKKEEKEENVKGHYRKERSYGSFYRTIALPTEIETDKAEAIYKNGVLSITLPKTKETQQGSKKLSVKAG